MNDKTIMSALADEYDRKLDELMQGEETHCFSEDFSQKMNHLNHTNHSATRRWIGLSAAAVLAAVLALGGILLHNNADAARSPDLVGTQETHALSPTGDDDSPSEPAVLVPPVMAAIPEGYRLQWVCRPYGSDYLFYEFNGGSQLGLNLEVNAYRSYETLYIQELIEAAQSGTPLGDVLQRNGLVIYVQPCEDPAEYLPFRAWWVQDGQILYIEAADQQTALSFIDGLSFPTDNLGAITAQLTMLGNPDAEPMGENGCSYYAKDAGLHYEFDAEQRLTTIFSVPCEVGAPRPVEELEETAMELADKCLLPTHSTTMRVLSKEAIEGSYHFVIAELMCGFQTEDWVRVELAQDGSLIRADICKENVFTNGSYNAELQKMWQEEDTLSEDQAAAIADAQIAAYVQQHSGYRTLDCGMLPSPQGFGGKIYYECYGEAEYGGTGDRLWFTVQVDACDGAILSFDVYD